MQALRLPALHVAAAARGAAPERPAAARCAPVAARRIVATRVHAAAAPAPRLRRALRVQAAATVDVTPMEVTDVTKGRVVVVGGCASREPRVSVVAASPATAAILTQRACARRSNGFVGSAVCKACVEAGLPVTSVSRSGAPPGLTAPWTSGVDYKKADCTDADAMAAIMAGASAVVSCVGGFGSNEAMLKINGTVNEAAVAAASAAVRPSLWISRRLLARRFLRTRYPFRLPQGVPRFVFVSVHRYNVPDALTDAIGYFKGKRGAEKAVLNAYGAAGSVLQPGFIYGDRLVGTMTLPLGAVGAPLERALRGAAEGPLSGVLKALSALPASDALLAPPVSVEAVAAAALRCATGSASGVFDIDAINKLAAEAKA